MSASRALDGQFPRGGVLAPEESPLWGRQTRVPAGSLITDRVSCSGAVETDGAAVCE